MTTCIIDTVTGQLTLEGLSVEDASILSDLLPAAELVNCARPLPRQIARACPDPAAAIAVRLHRIYHGSVVDGPGRRNVVQFQGCPLACPACFVPDTHGPDDGFAMDVASAAAAVCDQRAGPFDGITVLGGEPFAQPEALAHLLRVLRDTHHVRHITVYTGYRLPYLERRAERDDDDARWFAWALAGVDLLIDGPFIAGLSDSPGEWRGSRNQTLWTREHLDKRMRERMRP